MAKKSATKRKKKTTVKSRKGPIEEIELSIKAIERRLAKEGNTDEVEDVLDEIEHQINIREDKGASRTAIKELKSRLDKIK